MKKKGISPLIAAVLLIAFTMAVASLFAQWAPQLIQNAQGDTSNRTETIQQCSGVTLSFQEANTQNATIVQSTGSEPAGNVTVTWFYDSNDPVRKYAELNGAGSAKRLTTEGTTSPGWTLNEVRGAAVNCEGAGSANYKPPNP
jgi:flagellin-like protein